MKKGFKRRFTAPLDDERCNGNVRLKDGSYARCMHKKKKGKEFCRQHVPLTEE